MTRKKKREPLPNSVLAVNDNEVSGIVVRFRKGTTAGQLRAVIETLRDCGIVDDVQMFRLTD